MLILLCFNLIASAWLPRLDYGGGGGGSNGGAKRRGKGGKGGKGGGGGPLLSRLERAYLWGLVPLELATSWVLPPLLGERLPFLPLMAVSLYCALGMLHAWRRLAALSW